MAVLHNYVIANVLVPWEDRSGSLADTEGGPSGSLFVCLEHGAVSISMRTRLIAWCVSLPSMLDRGGGEID